APRHCPCGEEGTWLCGRCAALLEAPPRRVESSCDALQVLTAARVRAQHRDGRLLPAGVDHSPLLPVLALGEYGGDLQRLVLAWKNGGMLHLGARIAPALVPAVTRLAAGGGVTDPALVPVPSRRGARLRRAEDHTAELVRALARAGAGPPLLLRARPTTTQDGQGARQRRTRRIRLQGGPSGTAAPGSSGCGLGSTGSEPPGGRTGRKPTANRGALRCPRHCGAGPPAPAGASTSRRALGAGLRGPAS